MLEQRVDQQALLWVPIPAQDTWCLLFPTAPAAGVPRSQRRGPGGGLVRVGGADLGSAAPASTLSARAAASCLRKWTLECGLRMDVPHRVARAPISLSRFGCRTVRFQNEDPCCASGPGPL